MASCRHVSVYENSHDNCCHQVIFFNFLGCRYATGSWKNASGVLENSWNFCNQANGNTACIFALVLWCDMLPMKLNKIACDIFGPRAKHTVSQHCIRPCVAKHTVTDNSNKPVACGFTDMVSPVHSVPDRQLESIEGTKSKKTDKHD